MPADPTLESLIANGHFGVAADHYEEKTGDSELAAIMRIEGLEWELLNDVPGLKMACKLTDIDEGRFVWWSLQCGKHDFGTVGYEPLDGIPQPKLLTETPIMSILLERGLQPGLATRLYELYLAAISRVCVIGPSD